jgi:YhcH/YjgK/YiaL family protein
METEHKSTNSELTVSDATEWLKNRAWANGIEINPHATVNAGEFEKAYQLDKSAWDNVFLFIKNHDLSELIPGKYSIDADDVYAIITEAPSKTFEQSGWEAHRRYIDLQYVITGEEKIGIAPLATATVTKAYDEEKDYANFDAEGEYYVATPEQFFLFFPNDVHRPNILINEFPVVKKLVIKIKITQNF